MDVVGSPPSPARVVSTSSTKLSPSSSQLSAGALKDFSGHSGSMSSHQGLSVTMPEQLEPELPRRANELRFHVCAGGTKSQTRSKKRAEMAGVATTFTSSSHKRVPASQTKHRLSQCRMPQLIVESFSTCSFPLLPYQHSSLLAAPGTILPSVLAWYHCQLGQNL